MFVLRRFSHTHPCHPPLYGLWAPYGLQLWLRWRIAWMRTPRLSILGNRGFRLQRRRRRVFEPEAVPRSARSSPKSARRPSTPPTSQVFRHRSDWTTLCLSLVESWCDPSLISSGLPFFGCNYNPCIYVSTNYAREMIRLTRLGLLIPWKSKDSNYT